MGFNWCKITIRTENGITITSNSQNNLVTSRCNKSFLLLKENITIGVFYLEFNSLNLHSVAVDACNDLMLVANCKKNFLLFLFKYTNKVTQKIIHIFFIISKNNLICPTN